MEYDSNPLSTLRPDALSSSPFKRLLIADENEITEFKRDDATSALNSTEPVEKPTSKRRGRGNHDDEDDHGDSDADDSCIDKDAAIGATKLLHAFSQAEPISLIMRAGFPSRSIEPSADRI